MIKKWTLDKMIAAPQGVRRLTSADLRVVFQPIIDVATGRMFAHEALVRCRLPEFANPAVLFENAVRDEFCGRLGRLIRDVTFRTCGDVPIFVNLHPDELASHWLVQPDEPLCFHTKPVFLEVTESAMLTHYDLCMHVLKEVSSRTNARVVVDDFGAGYSNLDRLADLEPAIVKLDLALIRDIHLQRRRQSVVRHMVNLCAELGASVVAEGVEQLDELKCVRDLGVEYVQGYLLARPEAPPPVHAWPLTPTRRSGPPRSHGSRAPLSGPAVQVRRSTRPQQPSRPPGKNRPKP
jgi:EAL domain-containing protein (putative c-di-GMP-specific phosphodiesterase class I)